LVESLFTAVLLHLFRCASSFKCSIGKTITAKLLLCCICHEVGTGHLQLFPLSRAGLLNRYYNFLVMQGVLNPPIVSPDGLTSYTSYQFGAPQTAGRIRLFWCIRCREAIDRRDFLMGASKFALYELHGRMIDLRDVT
jgi:hypothetical protein